MTYAAIMKNRAINSTLLSLKFIMRIPTMLKSGNSEGISRNAFSPVVSLRLEKEKVTLLLLRYAAIDKITMAMPKESRRELVDKGVV